MPPRFASRCTREALAVALPICAIAVFILWNLNLIPDWRPITTPLALGAALAARLHQRVKTVIAAFATPAFDVALLVPLFRRFEAEQFQSPLLQTLQSRLTDSSFRASRRVTTLSWLSRLLSWRMVQGFEALAAILLWTTNFAMAIESWRRRNGRRLTDWLDSLGQFEALLCFARYHYENPGHSFPTLQNESHALFYAEALGHPLIDAPVCVTSDVQLDPKCSQLILVSGSNMSGKSTLLRAVGVNAVLAWAGAPVRARRLSISPLQVCSSIGIQDSLLEGKSRFQAEVERLKWILTTSATRPVLFLLDEMLGGTNSNDRFFGAKAIIEQLVGTGAVGLITTHDLALTRIADSLGSRAINVHFEEYYEAGEMRFDYKMRPGVLARTNGLGVISALGLLPRG
jgi:MutS-like protein